MSPSVEPLVSYMATMAKPGATSNNVQDLNLTRLYLGFTRAKGENLGRMDKQGLAALAPLDTRFGNAISGFLSGRDLTDQVRKDMWKTVVSNMAELQGQRDALKEQIYKRADANKVPRNLIFGED